MLTSLLRSLILIVDIDAPRVERAPVAILRAGRIVNEIAKLGRAAPAGLAGIDHLGILTEGEPRFEHFLRGRPRHATSFHRVAHITPSEGVRLHQRFETGDLFHDIVLCAARKIENAHAPAFVGGEEIAHARKLGTRAGGINVSTPTWPAQGCTRPAMTVLVRTVG